MSTIQVRIDDKTKKSAQKVLNDVGLDMSSAIKVYLKRIIITKSIPFQLLTENGLTEKEEREILKASKEARAGKNVTKAMNAKEAIEYLKNLK